ncbi:M20 family metallopeptidase [Pseudonocardia spinosispora]|uniref:M20 family metallopeptidase n=1 Tax=Pseudonocardia spinosispora TaxID=103441 RepID=UPI0004281488|nr:M20 family metallopeptidase [Pseudonocardia spinosispora]
MTAGPSTIDAAASARARVDVQRCAALAAAMVQCDTRNPPGDESSIIGLLSDVLRGLGARVETFEPSPGRTSLLASVEHGADRPNLLVNGHLDVVPVVDKDWSVPPFGGVIRDDVLYGRGSCDMKGGIASAIEGLRACADAGVRPSCDITFHLVADEETGGRWGTEALLRAGRISADAAIVPEPSELGVCVAERGALLAEIVVSGRAAHGSDPARGRSAIGDAARLVRAVQEADLGDPAHALLGTPTCNVGVISGGTAPNIVASSCTLRVDRRVLPGQSREYAVETLRAALDGAGTDIDYRLDVLAFVEGSELDSAHPFVGFMRAATNPGRPVRGLYLGTDARFLRNQLGIPTVVYGPGSMTVAHTADEYVPLAELGDAARSFATAYATYPVTGVHLTP